jgi:hypothetical protein
VRQPLHTICADGAALARGGGGGGGLGCDRGDQVKGERGSAGPGTGGRVQSAAW